MRRMVGAARAAGMAAVLLLAATEAGALCVLPRVFEQPPGQPPLMRPHQPSCLDRFTWPPAECDAQELRWHRRAVEDYLAELELFARRARRYAEAVQAYAWDSEAYADCEARELARW